MTVSEQIAGSARETIAEAQDAPAEREVIYRHSLAVRVTHWINVLCLTLLLMSGLKIFNYHPALYWGNYGYQGVPSFISISGAVNPATSKPVGTTRIGDYSFDTTGVLGVSVPLKGIADDAKNQCGAAPCALSMAHTTTTFVFKTGKPGKYRWQCFVPCAFQFPLGFGGPMQSLGWMDGYLMVG